MFFQSKKQRIQKLFSKLQEEVKTRKRVSLGDVPFKWRGYCTIHELENMLRHRIRRLVMKIWEESRISVKDIPRKTHQV
jgi:hypothetical protein